MTTVKTTRLGDLPRDSIGQPDAVILPDPSVLFARRAERLRVLAVGHPMADWLRFLALLADGQHRACEGLGIGHPMAIAGAAGDDRAAGDEDATPPLAADSTRPDASFDHVLAQVIAVGDDPSVPDVARAVLLGLSSQDTHALADAWLSGTLAAKHAGEAVPIAAALQVWFTVRAAALDVSKVHLLARRGVCPVCASCPVAGVITASGKASGVRYLHCGLCATAWNHVRASCIGCGESKGLALQEVEGGTGAVKAETCDACRGFGKMFYMAKDMAIEPVADDLASLGLDLMVSDAGWSRLAPQHFHVE